MEIYWILVLFCLLVDADITLSTENSSERREIQASEQMEDLKEQADAKQISSDQQLKDKDTELLLKMVKEMKEQISKMEMQIQARETQMQSHDKSIRELVDQVNFLKRTWTGSCLPFTNSTDIYTIKLPGMGSVDVPCNSSVSGSGWTVIQRRVRGNVNFNRTWSEYKHGFGDLRENLFLGLEKIHLMTLLQPHELYIQLQHANGSTSYARYDDFKIGSEAEAYKLKSLGKYSGTAEDSLAFHEDMKFSTFDRDNLDCAKYFGGGWWFDTCAESNLNGIYYPNGTSSKRDGIFWGAWQKDNYTISLTFTQMMIRPKVM
ncbi:microfibril-associated glycoprotein 4-like [Drosophila persimilis]|uniref:microfibril-associated glycoprotein 4-like n=1 Tax=Drosophila persimilis TaxID=7234 RepID=UPI000F0788A2|nr:microfibril-associated glycoprotein 4-like [Drosophila persimilis]